jgi:hypothetical protein
LSSSSSTSSTASSSTSLFCISSSRAAAAEQRNFWSLRNVAREKNTDKYKETINHGFLHTKVHTSMYAYMLFCLLLLLWACYIATSEHSIHMCLLTALSIHCVSHCLYHLQLYITACSATQPRKPHCAIAVTSCLCIAYTTRC